MILLKSFKYLRKQKIKTVIDQTLIASMNYIKLIISRKNKIDENLIATKNDIYTYLAYKKFNGLWRKKVFFDKYERFIKGKQKLNLKRYYSNLVKFKNSLIDFFEIFFFL